MTTYGVTFFHDKRKVKHKVLNGISLCNEPVHRILKEGDKEMEYRICTRCTAAEAFGS